MKNSLIEKLAVKALIVKGTFDVNRMKSNARNARSVNEKLLFNILKNNQNSEYGKKYNFSNIHSVEDYRKYVPIIEYKDIEKEVESIYYENKQNVLCTNEVVGFAKSSGSVGKSKILSKTKVDVKVYENYTVTRFLALADEYARKTKGHGIKLAKGISILGRDETLSPHGLPASNVADIAERKYRFIEPYIMKLPLKREFLMGEVEENYIYARFGLQERDCSYIFCVFAKGIIEFIEYIRDNWQKLVNDIETGTLSEDIFIKEETRTELNRIVKPDPVRANELRKEFEKGFDETILNRIWPNLSVISSIGTSASFEGFVKDIKKYTKNIPLDYSIYGASEGLMAAAHEIDKTGQLLLVDSCYYEFVEEDDENLEHILNIDELEVGKKYEIILTNQSGFYRYRIKDVLKVVDYYGSCPVIEFVYRKGQLLNITGEKTNLEQMSESVNRLAKEANTNITEWAVMVEKGENRYRYVLLAENSDNKDLSQYGQIFDKILIEVNTAYGSYHDLIEPPRIINQKVGTHKEWRQHKIDAGAPVSQVKPVRSLDTKEKEDFFLQRVEA